MATRKRPTSTPDDGLDYRKEEIRQTLVRNVLTDPLYGNVIEDPEALFDIMIDANLEYHQGRDNVFKAVIELAKQAVAEAEMTRGAKLPKGVRLPWSVGSPSNPYLAAKLPGYVIQRLVQLDADRAAAAVADAKKEWEKESPESVAKAERDPIQEHRYRCIHRIWDDFKIFPLIDKSCSTVKADAAWRAFLAEGKDIVWAVIDSGIDRTHGHFSELNTLKVSLPVKHWDFTIDNGEGSDTALVDKFGHGTHVAGIIAGSMGRNDGPKPQAVRKHRDPSGQVRDQKESLPSITGMAPCCKLVSFKVLDDNGQGNVRNIIEAIDAILRINDYGRRLLIHGVNLSVGYEFDPKWFACGQSPVCVEVDRLVRSGVVVIVAAGNTGYGVLQSNARPTGAGLQLTINDPGNAEFAITVGSTHRDMPHTYGVSYFSSKGPTGDGRLKPDVVAPGERILSCKSTMGEATASTNEYVEDSGTSMAAPHVSGVIAGFLSIRREFIGRPEEIKKLFLSTATSLNRERNFQGHGLVDLMRAIQTV